MVPSGEKEVAGGVGVWDYELQTIMYKIDKQQGNTAHLFYNTGFPGGASGKEPVCQCRRPERCGFNPWVGKIP